MRDSLFDAQYMCVLYGFMWFGTVVEDNADALHGRSVWVWALPWSPGILVGPLGLSKSSLEASWIVLGVSGFSCCLLEVSGSRVPLRPPAINICVSIALKCQDQVVHVTIG